MQNPDVTKQLATEGTQIELKENESRQLQLKIVLSADVKRVLASLGVEEE